MILTHLVMFKFFAGAGGEAVATTRYFNPFLASPGKMMRR